MATSRRSSGTNMFSQAKSQLVAPKAKEEAVIEEVKEVKAEEVKEIEKEPEKASVKEKESPKKAKEKQAKATKTNSLFTKKEKVKSLQKSFYIKEDNYDYIKNVANEYGLSLSEVLNIIIDNVKENEE